MTQSQGLALALIVCAIIMIVLNVRMRRRMRQLGLDGKGTLYGIVGMVFVIVAMALLLTS